MCFFTLPYKPHIFCVNKTQINIGLLISRLENFLTKKIQKSSILIEGMEMKKITIVVTKLKNKKYQEVKNFRIRYQSIVVFICLMGLILVFYPNMITSFLFGIISIILTVYGFNYSIKNKNLKNSFPKNSFERVSIERWRVSFMVSSPLLIFVFSLFLFPIDQTEFLMKYTNQTNIGVIIGILFIVYLYRVREESGINEIKEAIKEMRKKL